MGLSFDIKSFNFITWDWGADVSLEEAKKETIKEEGIEFLLVYFFVAKLVMDNDVSKEDSYCPQ